MSEKPVRNSRALSAAETRALMERPARRQATEVKQYTPQMSGDYNIWYHRYSGFEYRENRRERGTLTRCVAARDTGKTRASATAPICLHFALGNCAKGPLCTFRHQVPDENDEKRVGITHDVFGRERFKTDRNDMGGVGSFSRENRTLFIGGLKSDLDVKEYEGILRKHFGEWGELEYARVIPMRGFGFVRYKLRVVAEFAKVAMSDQPLDDDETINMRWAYADPNPIAKAADEQAATAKAIKGLEEAVAALTPEQKLEKLAVQQAHQIADNPTAYPDTSTQFMKFGDEAATEDVEGAPAEKKVRTGDMVSAHVDYKYTFAPAIKGSNLPSKPDKTAAEKYVPNPDTGELHPYAIGLIYPRQAMTRGNESMSEHARRIATFENAFSYEPSVPGVYTEADGAELPGAAAAPDDDHDEPGYHNDAPLF